MSACLPIASLPGAPGSEASLPSSMTVSFCPLNCKTLQFLRSILYTLFISLVLLQLKNTSGFFGFTPLCCEVLQWLDQNRLADVHVAVSGDVCCWENVMNYVTFKSSILLSFSIRFMYVCIYIDCGSSYQY